MAVTVWLVRQTQFNGGRLGAVRLESDLAADLIKKGDALAFDKNLRRALYDLRQAERAEPEPPAEGEAEPKRKAGRPPKAKAKADPEPAEPAADPETTNQGE